MNFSATSEFLKDVKRLTKKWRSIPSDLEAVRNYIVPLYDQLAPDIAVADYRRNFFAGKTAAILFSDGVVEVIKMRLDVADLGTKDAVRIIFVAVKTRDVVTFVELYAKNEKTREDPKRYKQLL